MTAIDFYRITCRTLEELARMRGVKDLEKYYFLTDYLAFPQLGSFREVEQAFMQIAFHGQNATMISNIVSFEKNYEALKTVLCDFNPHKFLETYSANKRDENVSRLISAFREAGLTWNSGKSTKSPDAIMRRYSNTLLDAAEYLIAFNCKSEIVQDLLVHYQNGDTECLVKYFKEKIKSGFSVALTCDFLKEYAPEFSNLPKPDVHIMDTMRALLNRDKNYYAYDKGAYRCIKDLQNIVGEINCELKKTNEREITVYQLDRMIWLICADKFFLDEGPSNSKALYLSFLG